MPRPKVTLTTCTEQLGGESDHSHGSEVLQLEKGFDDISPSAEPVLRRMLEKVTLLEEERRRVLPPPMPWRGTQLVTEKQGGRLVLKEVATKNPFVLRASRADGRFRLTRVAPFDGLDEVSVRSNGAQGFDGEESGVNGKKY